MTEELKSKIIAFFENCEKFFGKMIEIKEAISNNQLNFDRHFTTFAYTEFILTKVYARISGGRVTFEGDKLYYEISIDNLLIFNELNENEFEFIESCSAMVYRRTKIRMIEIETNRPRNIF